jgi:uncharacterized SAM-binding protein YcdF (DUF218 family)
LTDAEATKMLFRQDEPTKADVALVFGSNEELLSKARARQASWLYLNGFVRLVVLTGGTNEPEALPEAVCMAKVLSDHGIPQSAMLLEVTSRNTVENVRNSLHMLDEKNLLTEPFKILLVSCPWHMRRIFEISKRIFPLGTGLVSAPHSECCTATNWSTSPICRSRVQNELRLLGATPLVPSIGDNCD